MRHCHLSFVHYAFLKAIKVKIPLCIWADFSALLFPWDVSVQLHCLSSEVVLLSGLALKVSTAGDIHCIYLLQTRFTDGKLCAIECNFVLTASLPTASLSQCH